ncbi:radical SAM/SPASM domain-containing protein [Xanthobacter versatilis]|uniref:radical SAM/SPASM domain-containing protein n=1 Tax=Xanthobacter autotrophicus (strain ATCC BAA-1158 / Py2) TaxID=78245 RepID=UPI0037272B16
MNQIARISQNRESGSDNASLKLLWLEITRACNWSCSHCYSESGPSIPLRDRVADDRWLALLTEAADLGCGAVQFIGGEPTAHPLLAEMIRHAHAEGICSIEVYTNASRLSDAVMGAMQDCRATAKVSFYAPHADIHDRIVAKKGGFKKAVAGLERLLGNQIPVSCGIVVMAENKDMVQQTVAFLNDLGIGHISIDHVRGIGRGQSAAPVSQEIEALCGACWNERLSIASSGFATPCIMSRSFVVGDIVTQSLREILVSQELDSARRFIRNAHLSTMGDCNPNCAPTRCNPVINCNPQNCNPMLNCGPSKCNPAN